MKSDFLIVHKKILPVYYEKVLEARQLVESGAVRDVSAAVRAVGISRSTYYKYKDFIYSPDNGDAGRKAVISMQLSHEIGVLSTAEMRAALPKQIPFADASYNIAHAAVLLKALEAGDFDAIAAAMDDKLHQPYRSPLIHEYDEIRSRALEAGALGFAISGAGPTLFCVYQDEGFYWRMKQAVRSLKHQWRVMPLPVDRVGAVVVGGGQE